MYPMKQQMLRLVGRQQWLRGRDRILRAFSHPDHQKPYSFETDFFGRHGFEPIGEDIVAPDVYAQLVRSQDEGIAEFLDLSRVKPNTLGNTRMLKSLQLA